MIGPPRTWLAAPNQQFGAGGGLHLVYKVKEGFF